MLWIGFGWMEWGLFALLFLTIIIACGWLCAFEINIVSGCFVIRPYVASAAVGTPVVFEREINDDPF